MNTTFSASIAARWTLRMAPMLLALALSACGGGNGGESSPPPPAAPSQPAAPDSSAPPPAPDGDVKPELRCAP